MPNRVVEEDILLLSLRHLLFDEDMHRLLFGLSLFHAAQYMHLGGSLEAEVTFSSPPVG
jgi:hypothetical protein